jgi:hypothetical protein
VGICVVLAACLILYYIHACIAHSHTVTNTVMYCNCTVTVIHACRTDWPVKHCAPNRRDTALHTSEDRAAQLIRAQGASTALQLHLDAAVAE